MFTGIVEELGQVQELNDYDDFLEIKISSSFSSEINIGDSIAINGVCLTAVSNDSNSFVVNVVKETIAKTNLKSLKKKSYVNLERAVLVSSRLNGHIVQGHVESVARIVEKRVTDKQTDLTLDIDKNYIKYCIYKGSIALDGISLTISSINGNNLSVAIIPHTLNNTTLKYKEVDDYLNLETDVFAKYVENIIAAKN